MRSYHYKSTIISLLSVAILGTIGTLMLARDTFAAETTATKNARVSVSTACSMIGTVDTPHSATLVPGTYTTDIGQTTLKTICNDRDGFAIYAIGYSNDEWGNTKLLSTAGSAYDINTGTATSGNTSAWSMKVSAVSGTFTPTIYNSFDSYHVVPSTATKVAGRTATTGGDTASEGSSVKTTYATYTSPSQVAATYNGKVKYMLLHPYSNTPCLNHCTLTFNANGGTGGAGTVTQEIDRVFDLNNYTTIPTKEEYTFSGYSTTSTATTPEYAYNSTTGKFTPHLYEVGPTDTATLYAVWYEVPKCVGYQKMQDIATIKGALEEEQQVQLCDTRDEKIYWVSKLKDGNVWMTQNLDHNIDATKTYTSHDTDIPSDWTPSLGTYATGSPTWASSTTTPESYDPGERYWDGTIDTEWSTTIDDMPTTGDSHYHIGNYYNWTAALAMNDSSAYGSTFGQNTNQSICPAGWTLPKGGTTEDWSALAPDNQFYPLLNNYLSGATWDGTSWSNVTLSQVYNSPLYFVLGSSWYGSSEGVASNGSYWSSTVVDSNNVFVFYFYADGVVVPGSGYFRNFGISVRCVAR